MILSPSSSSSLVTEARTGGGVAGFLVSGGTLLGLGWGVGVGAGVGVGPSSSPSFKNR